MSSEDQNKELVDKGWDQMKVLLDEEMPEDKGAFPFWWLLALLILLLGSGAFWLVEQSPVSSPKENASVAQLENAGVNDVETIIAEVERKNLDASKTARDAYKKQQTSTGNGNYSNERPFSPNLGQDKADYNTSLHLNDGHTMLTSERISLLNPLKAHEMSLLAWPFELHSQDVELVKARSSIDRENTALVSLWGSSNALSNIGFQLDGGWNYTLGRRWSAFSTVGYQYQYFSKNSIFNLDREDLAIEPGVTVGGAFNQDLSDAEITFDQITQHFISLTQGIQYRISPKWSAYGNAGICYAFNSRSGSQLKATYPEIVNGGVIQMRTVQLEPGEISNYIENWYYKFGLGMQYALNEHWSVGAGLSHMRSFKKEYAGIELNDARSLMFDLGVSWKL